MQTHNPTELLDAFDGLSRIQIKQLHSKIREFIGGTNFTSTFDLLHEVLYRHMTGDRSWPVGVNLMIYLINCARSVASSSRQLAEHANLSLDAMMESEDSDWKPPRHGARMDFAPSAEDVAIANERLRRCQQAAEDIREEMRDDPIGRMVLAGILADLTPAEMRQSFNARESTIKAARQRVHNRLKAWREENPL